jgi:hypothetical protein
MSSNLFESCKTESDIMKRLFELSSSDKYTRVELLSMSNARRSELQNSQPKGLDFKKVSVSEENTQAYNESAKKLVSFSDNPKGSSVFEFLPNGMVRF